MIVRPILVFHSPCHTAEDVLHLLQTRLACGFPSPANDYLEQMPSLNELLIKHPAATFIGRAQGDSMIERGILDGSLLIIDRSLTPLHDSTIVASIAGELTIKILDLQNRLLRPANSKQLPLPLPDDLDVICEGVVTFCITPQAHSVFPC
jgi:DNA polymerase V